MSQMKIGKNVFINSNMLAMARGGITIEDGVQIAGNVQLLSNNHDPYDLAVLTCKPVVIKEAAWIGAGSTILPGVCVGRHAIVGAASVVTKDVPDYAVVVGNPAKVIRMLDKEIDLMRNMRKNYKNRADYNGYHVVSPVLNLSYCTFTSPASTFL